MENLLEQAREIIDDVDARMAELFVKRMRAAEMVYAHKKELGLPILDQTREAAVIERNTARIEDETLKAYYMDYLKHVMAVSRAYQYRLQNGLRVACSGEEGAFSHIAAGRIFPESQRISCRDFKAVYDSVVSGENDVAVLPIENSYAGEVGQTLDLIFSGSLSINGIYELEIPQNLLGVPEASANTARFAVLSRVPAASLSLSHSVLMFTVRNEAGALAEAIGIIGKYGYNMTALRSRPMRKHSGQYYFYIEINGSTATAEGKQMLEELNHVCHQLKVAGTFAPHVEI